MFMRIIFKTKANSECSSEPFCEIKFMDFSTLTFDFIIALLLTQHLFFKAEVVKSLIQLGRLDSNTVRKLTVIEETSLDKEHSRVFPEPMLPKQIKHLNAMFHLSDRNFSCLGQKHRNLYVLSLF